MAEPTGRRPSAGDIAPVTPRGFATRAIRAAHRIPIVDQPPTSVPIYQSVTFTTADAAELGAVTTRQIAGYSYGRLDNPTVAAFAAAVAELEGAEAAFAFATGMGAIHGALGTLLSSGDRIVATQASYGTTRAQLLNVFGRLGVRVDFVDVTDLAAVEAALALAPTRVLYAETISNPTIVVADHAALAGLAHRFGATYVVDNTFASPYLCRPLELGADLVCESATKYLSGHSDVMAGVVVGSASLVGRVRDFEVDTGASLDPHAAFLAMRGLSTLALRMERHSATAATLSGWLEAQPGVTRVWHPALASHPQHATAARQLARGGGMLAFELAGGRAAGEAFIDSPDGVAGERLHDRYPPAVDDPPPARRRGAHGGGDHARPAPLLGRARGRRRPDRRLCPRARGRGIRHDAGDVVTSAGRAGSRRTDSRLTFRRTDRSPAP